MKLVSKPIDAVVVFSGTKKPVPYRFKYVEQDGSRTEVRVDKIISSEETRPAGRRTYVYECQSLIRGVERRYQLKYVLEEARWELYKI